jgi:hypothetical protein
MLPALEGEIKLKDESAQTFEQVIANAAKANQALQGTQAQITKLEEVFTRLNVRSDQGKFFDTISGKGLSTDDVLKRTITSDNLGGATYRELAPQIKAYAAEVESATLATVRFQQQQAALDRQSAKPLLPPVDTTGFDRLTARLANLKTNIDDLDKRAEQFQRTMASGASGGRALTAESAAFDQIAQSVDKSSTSLKTSQDEVKKLDAALAQLNARSDQRGGFFDTLTGGNLRMDDILQRALSVDASSGSNAGVKELSNELRQYVEATKIATQASGALTDKLGNVGAGGADSLDKVHERMEKLKADTVKLQEQTEKYYKSLGQGAAQGQQNGNVFGLALPETTKGIVTVVGGAAQLLSGFESIRQSIPDKEVDTFFQRFAVGIPSAGAGLFKIVGGLSAIATGLDAVGVNVPEKALEVFLNNLDKVPNSVKDLTKLAFGMGEIADVIPETKVSSFLQNILTMIPGISQGFLKAATAAGAITTGVGAIASALIYVNNEAEKFLDFVYQSEVRANNANWLSIRLDTTQLEQDMDGIQTMLDRRISEQELSTIMLKVDPRDALSGLENFGQVAKTVQAYADEFGMPWVQALDQVVAAIGKGDGAFLQQQGYIWDAQKAFNDYADSHGKTVGQLTELERQQALVNAVLKENAGLFDEVTTNAEISRAANERFTAQLADMGSALSDFISAWANNKLDGVLNWFADDGTVGPAMAGLEKYLSDAAGDERIRAQLNDAAEANFDALLAERDRVAASITDLTAELPKAQASGDQQRVAWITSNIEMLEGRMKAIDMSVTTAREDVFSGRAVTPLPEARSTDALAGEMQKRNAEISTQYDKQITEARQELVSATNDLQVAEKRRQETVVGDPNKQLVIDTYEAQLQKKRDELNLMDQDIQSAREDLANPPQVPYDVSQDQAKVESMTGQVTAMNGQLDNLGTRIAQLNNASNLVSQITGLTEKIKSLQQSGGSEEDVQDLVEQRSQNLQNFMQLADNLSKQGITIAAPDMPIEETTAAINDQTQKAYTMLQDYKDRMTDLQRQIYETNVKIAQAPKTTSDSAYVQQLDAQLAELTQKRQQVAQEIAQIEQGMATMQDTQSPAAVAAIEGARQAELAQKAADARVKLLEAEKTYLSELNTLQGQAANGNVEMWEAAQKRVEEAASGLSSAYQNFFAANANNAQGLVEAQNRLKEQLGEGFLQDLQSGKIPILDIFKTDDLSEQAAKKLEEAQDAFDANPVSIPVKLGDATISREDALKLVEEAQAALKTAGQNLTGAYVSGDDQAIEQAQVNRDAAVAQSEQAIATLEYVQAVRELTEARQTGIESAIAEAEVEVSNAQAKYEAASASMAAAQTKIAETQATGEATNAALGQAAALELIKIANQEAAAAEAEHAVMMEGTAMVAGILVDAVSGLPLAFNAAELNAAQLGQALVTLETQMQNIESAAISAGFSIANRLIPVMGLAGSLQQAGKWAEQARGVREQFNQINQNRMTEGQTPLGGEVLNASMDALKQSWNAMATDSVAAMRKVETAGAGGANAMEQAVKRMDQALNGLIQGVLKDSTKGLIPVDDLLPREDTVDEKARRMADVAVKGYKSPWFEGLKDMFPDEVLNQGEGKVKESAARMVRDHQQGLTTMFYDTEMAADKVLEQIQAKANMGEFIDQVREKVKEKGADVKDLDIMDALGIDTSEQRMAGAAAGAQKTMSEIVPGYEEILNQLSQLGEAESPIIEYLTPSDEGKESLKTAGTDAATTIGEQVVTQATEGAYGTRAIDAIINQMKVKEDNIKKAGRDLADWLGTALTTQFKTNVPGDLFDILIVELIPLMTKALAVEGERGATATP